MTGSALLNAATFLITLFFEAYLYILLLRLFLQKLGAPYHNPFCQLLLKLTQPLVKPLQRLAPGIYGFDLAIMVLAIVLVAIEFTLILWLTYAVLPGFMGIVIVAISQLLNKSVNIFFFATIISAVISWFPALNQGPFTELIHVLAAPLMNIARRRIPPIGGFDLSPIVIVIALKLFSMLVLWPLIRFGYQLAI